MRPNQYPSGERSAITPGSFDPYLSPGAGGTMGDPPSDGGGWDWGKFGEETALGGLGGGLLGQMFGGDSGPSASSYLSKIPGEVEPYLKPYMSAGAGMLPGLEKEYGQLAHDPAGMMRQIGGQYQQSPGLHFALQQALQGAGHSAALGGMAGSPMAQQQAEAKATGLAQQDYYNWLNKAAGMMGGGLQGMQGLAGMGQQAGMGMAEAIAQALSAQAQAAQERQATSAQQRGGFGSMMAQALPQIISAIAA